MGQRAYLRRSADPWPGVRGRRSRGLRFLVAVGLILTLAAPAAVAAGADATPLEARLERALSVRGVSASATGAVVIDLSTSEVVYEQNAALPLAPASNEKLTVAVAALIELGPDFRFETEALGVGIQNGTSWEGDVVLKGYGDPTLHAPDLARLARDVRAAGITWVTGSVLGDESFFDARRTAPGWKRSYYIEESAPLSALIVDRGKVRGKTAHDPALAAARSFRKALESAGVGVSGEAAEGVAPTDAVTLAWVTSEPVSRLVRWMNRESDNFVAEMLLKGLGARVDGAGTTRDGIRVVHGVLADLGLPLEGVRLRDGSGLSRGNRLTAQALAALLVAVRSDLELAGPFLDSLAVAGVNGTLEDRLERPPARGRVRAKTGTTEVSSSLAGYVGERYAFAVIMNGHPIPWWWARRGQDRFVRLLAAE